MDTKHTPGPWRIEKEQHGSFVMAGSYCIHRQGLSNADEANARLIAASPRMLDALNDVLGQLDLMPDDQGSISMFNTRQDGKPTKAAMAIRNGLRTMIQTIINDATNPSADL
jgi:hypothetical protein